MRVAVQSRKLDDDAFSDPVEMEIADGSPVGTMLNKPGPSDYVIPGLNGTETSATAVIAMALVPFVATPGHQIASSESNLSATALKGMDALPVTYSAPVQNAHRSHGTPPPGVLRLPPSSTRRQKAD